MTAAIHLRAAVKGLTDACDDPGLLRAACQILLGGQQVPVQPLAVPAPARAPKAAPPKGRSQPLPAALQADLERAIHSGHALGTIAQHCNMTWHQLKTITTKRAASPLLVDRLRKGLPTLLPKAPQPLPDDDQPELLELVLARAGQLGITPAGLSEVLGVDISPLLAAEPLSPETLRAVRAWLDC
jgi:hypothetical protein